MGRRSSGIRLAKGSGSRPPAPRTEGRVSRSAGPGRRGRRRRSGGPPAPAVPAPSAKMKLVLGRLERADCSGGERTPRPRSGGRLAVPPRPISARRPPPHPAPCPPLRRSSASDLGQEGGGSLPSKAVDSQLGFRAAGKGGADHPILGVLGNGGSPSPIQTPLRIGRWLFLTRTGGTVSQRVVPEPAAERGGGSGEVRAPLSPVPARVPLPVLSQHPLPGAPLAQGEPGTPPVLG